MARPLYAQVNLAALRETIAARAPAHLARCSWIEAAPDAPWQGALVANEVFDALPVRAFQRDADRVHARAVEWRDGRFAWTLRPADAALAARVDALAAGSPWPAPYRSELCELLPAWIAEVTRTLARGIALFVDYGYPRRDKEYHAGAALWHNKLAWQGLVPKLNFRYLKIDSNMPSFYSRSNAQWFVSVEKAF